MGNRPGFLKGVGGSPPASFKKPEIFTAKEAIMNRIIGQYQAMSATYGTEAQALPPQNSQVETYLDKLDSRAVEVEESLAELRRRLAPLLMPEQSSNACEPACGVPAVLSEAAYRIHRLTERLESIRGSIGDVLSRL